MVQRICEIVLQPIPKSLEETAAGRARNLYGLNMILTDLWILVSLLCTGDNLANIGYG